MIAGASWRVLVELVRSEGGDVVGALVVARPGRLWARWERSLVNAFGAVLSQGATLATRERSLLLERRLDGLVGQIAERLMSTSSRTRDGDSDLDHANHFGISECAVSPCCDGTTIPVNSA